MKKLLALILCVMLFVSVIPTSAFAYTATVGGAVNQNTQTYVDATTGKVVKEEAVDLTPKYQSTTNARRAVENLGKDINAMYTALAADQTVFGTAQSIYDMTDTLSKDLLKGIGSFKYFDAKGIQHEVYEEDLATNVRKGLNLVIGNTITNYMNERVGLFTSEKTVYKTNPDGTYFRDANGDLVVDHTYNVVKPDKYIEVWGNAVKNALSSEKAQKNIEAMVTGLFALKVQKSVNDGADDLYTDIVDWDHWGEFNWGKLIDPDQSGLTSYRVWNPLPDAKNHSALISTSSNGVFGWTHDVDANGNWIANTSGTKSQNATQNWVYTIDGNADLAFAAGTGFYLPNS
jgi:uncharacterized protein YxeA